MPYDAGILVVVYPDKSTPEIDAVAEFNFKYWISDEPIIVVEVKNVTNSTANETVRDFDYTQFSNMSIPIQADLAVSAFFEMTWIILICILAWLILFYVLCRKRHREKIGTHHKLGTGDIGMKQI